MSIKLSRPAVMSLAVIMFAACGVKKATHQKALAELTSCHTELEETKKVRDVQMTKVKQLEDELSATRVERDKKTQDEIDKEARIAKLLAEMKDNKQEVEVELLKLRSQRDQAEKRLSAYRELYDRFRALVDTGKLDVGFRNGQMVIKMPSGILFASGQAKLSKGGKAALSEVLAILIEFKERRFQVAGHTDNVRIRGRRFKNNWHLSSARALSVVEFMIEAGFAAKNLAATGFGEFDPIGDNTNEDGRALNRRIEIILVPDLSELPNLTADPS
jgi:chemotaxis protein MotB